MRKMWSGALLFAAVLAVGCGSKPAEDPNMTTTETTTIIETTTPVVVDTTVVTDTTVTVTQ